MKELRIETGLQEFQVNDKCVLRFNPADPAFADRIYTAFDALKKQQDSKAVDIETMPEVKALEYLRKLDADMRDTINGVFDDDVCTPLFGTMSVYASAGGTPLWMNLMMAIIDELDEGIKKEKAFHSEKLSKYTKKYHR